MYILKIFVHLVFLLVSYNIAAQDFCVDNYNEPFSNLSNWVKPIKPIIAESVGDFSDILPYVKVDSSCYKKMSLENFNNHFIQSQNKGNQCIKDIASKSPFNKGAIKLSGLIDKRIKQTSDKIKVTCDPELDLNWNNVVMFGSSKEIDPSEGLGFSHPLMVISPTLTENRWWEYPILKGQRLSDDEFRGMLYHEFIHNLGISHGDDIEYSYGCEVCCFGDAKENGKKYGKEFSAAACRLCAGNYESKLDPNHLNDISIFSRNQDTYIYLEFLGENFKDIDWSNKVARDSFINLFGRENPILAENITLALQGKEIVIDDKPKDLLINETKKVAKIIQSVIVSGDEEEALRVMKTLNTQEFPIKYKREYGDEKRKSVMDLVGLVSTFSQYFANEVKNPKLKKKLKDFKLYPILFR